MANSYVKYLTLIGLGGMAVLFLESPQFFLKSYSIQLQRKIVTVIQTSKTLFTTFVQ